MTSKRPAVLTEWIRNKRRPHTHRRLSKDQLEVMYKELIEWWFALQPRDRIPQDFDESLLNCSELLSAGDFDDPKCWSELYRGATNGLYGVLVCIGWWLEADNSPGAKFDSLVTDFCSVVEVLLSLPVPEVSRRPPSSCSSRRS